MFSAADFVTNFEKLHVGQEINKIYTKMIVFSKIKQGHNCLKNNDLAGLKKTLLDIEKLSSMHEFEDTPFSSYVKKSQNYFSVALIGLGQLN